MKEDMDKNEFNILVKTKGIKEIEKRKAFLFENAMSDEAIVK